MHLAVKGEKLPKRDEAQNRKQNDRHGRGKAEIEIFEPDFVNPKQQNRRCIIGSATRHHENMIDDAERIDQRIDHDKQGRWHEQRKSDTSIG